MATHIEPAPPRPDDYGRYDVSPMTPSGTPIFSILTPILAAVLSLLLIALVVYFAV
ncbi:MAG TPA: hypothetical protein VL326_22100 [Kofleriaceae bacterium]|jgi:hypothetical protein|nr:hypothetical protein [Kofleriaceae bacterium]